MTERGRTFLYEAERVVGDLLSLSDTARRLRGAPSDTLTLGMGSGMAQIFMPRLFGELRKMLPGVRLEILTAPTKNIFNDLHEERIDAGIAIESDPERVPAGLVFDRLTEAEMALIAHPTHRAGTQRASRSTSGSLVSEPIIMSELTVGYGQVVLSLFTDLGIRPEHPGGRRQHRDHEGDRAVRHAASRSCRAPAPTTKSRSACSRCCRSRRRAA